MLMKSSAWALNVSAPRFSMTAVAASESTRPWVCQADRSGACRTTSGTSPDAAPVTSAWSWSAPAMATTSTSIPVSSVNSSAMSCWAAIRSGCTCGVQKVIGPEASPPSPSSPPPEQAARARAAVSVRPTAEVIRRFTCIVLLLCIVVRDIAGGDPLGHERVKRRGRYVVGVLDSRQQQRGEFLADLGIGGLVVHRVQLQRVGLQVEQLPLRGARVVDRAGDPERLSVVVEELLAVGAHPDGGPDAGPEVLPVPVVGVLAPARRGRTAGERAQAGPLHPRRRRNAGVVQERLRQVQVQRKVGGDGTGGDRGRG